MGHRRSSFPTTRFSLPHVGAAKTRTPVILHHPTHRSVGYFGAVRLN